MNPRRLATPVIATAAFVTALVALLIAYRIASASARIDGQLRLRDSIYAALQERACTPLHGITVIASWHHGHSATNS